MAKVDDLFRDLSSQIEDEDFEASLSTCEKLLKTIPNDPDIVQIKVVSLLQTRKFKEAIEYLKSFPNQFLFEHAYALYRQNQNSEAMTILGGIPQEEKTEGVIHLEAQCNYRLAKFDKCVEIYSKQVSDASDNEELTNVLAAYVAAGQPQKAIKLASKSAESTFEVAYNISLARLDAGNIRSASKTLELAKKLCEESLQEYDLTEEEIKDEMAILSVQGAFLTQLKEPKKPDKAMKIYTSVLNDKPSDKSVIAVATNNIITLRKNDEKIFDSRKRSKVCLGIPETKLSHRQRRAIQLNHCLLLMYGKKGAECREVVLKLQKEFPDSEFPVLVLASLYFREGNDECDKILQEYIQQHPKDSLQSKLTLAHILLMQGKTDLAIQAIERIGAPLRHYPAVVAAKVVLFEKLNNIESANGILDEAVTFWNEQEESGKISAAQIKKYLTTLTLNSAEFKSRYQLYHESINEYKKICSNTKSDERSIYLSKMVIAASHFDANLTREYGEELPKLSGLDAIDVEKLEKGILKSDLKRKFREKEKKKLEDDGRAQRPQKKKKKKKKKPRYPKNFDPANPGPAPDPERWLPRWERSYYKKGKKRKQREKMMKMRGAQGGAGDHTVECNLQEMTPVQTSSGRNTFKPGKGQPRNRKKQQLNRNKKNRKDKKKDKKKKKNKGW